MSGLEIFSTAVTCLDKTVELISAIKDAVEDAKNLPKLLLEYRTELQMTGAIVRAVEEEPGLRTNVKITAITLQILGSAKTLEEHLESLDKGRKGVRAIAHQLLHGESDRKKLGKYMARLTLAKDNLTTLIGTENIKVAREIKSVLDRMAEEQQSGTSTPTASAANQQPITSRIIRHNQASGRAFQLNAPAVKGDAGVDPWLHITQVIVENNNASDDSKQINTAITIDNLRLVIDMLKMEVNREVEDEEDEDNTT